MIFVRFNARKLSLALVVVGPREGEGGGAVEAGEGEGEGGGIFRLNLTPILLHNYIRSIFKNLYHVPCNAGK